MERKLAQDHPKKLVQEKQKKSEEKLKKIKQAQEEERCVIYLEYGFPTDLPLMQILKEHCVAKCLDLHKRVFDTTI